MGYEILPSETIFTWGSPRRRREREGGGIENLSKETTAKNVPNLGRVMVIQVHKAQKYPRRFNQKRSLLGHIIIKFSKIEHRKKF